MLTPCTRIRIGRRGRLVRMTAVMLSGLALISACGERVDYWSMGEGPKQNRVDYTEFHHTVRFQNSSASITQAERRKLETFLGRIAQGEGVRISLMADRGTAALLATRRETSLADSLRKSGYQISLVNDDKSASPAAGTVRVTVGRYVVTAPKCPDWSKPATNDPNNTESSNLGCATATNLGLMVADPGALVHPYDTGPADGEFMALGVKKYREHAEEKSKSVSPLMILNGGSQ
jgi:pilus assembly protein CpaD